MAKRIGYFVWLHKSVLHEPCRNDYKGKNEDQNRHKTKSLSSLQFWYTENWMDDAQNDKNLQSLWQLFFWTVIIIGSTYAVSIWVIALFDWFVSPFQVGDMHIVWQSISSMSRSNPALGGENTIFLKLYGEWWKYVKVHTCEELETVVIPLIKLQLGMLSNSPISGWFTGCTTSNVPYMEHLCNYPYITVPYVYTNRYKYICNYT